MNYRLKTDSIITIFVQVDHVKFLAIDIVRKVTDHFEKIRVVRENNSSSSSNSPKKQQLPTFPVSPHLMSQEREIEYLIKVSETLILFLCPKSYGTCLPARHLLRELLARQVLAPAINLVTSPEFINSKVLAYIQKNQTVREMSVKTYQYAESFEDFVSMISSTNDTNELKQIR